MCNMSESVFFFFLKQAILFENRREEGEVEGHKLDTGPVVELVLKLHPEIKCSRQHGRFNNGRINDEE